MKAAPPAAPKAAAMAEARRSKLEEVVQAAAAKLPAETKEKKAKAEKKREDSLKEIAVEYLRREFGTKQKPASAALDVKLQQACRCPLTMSLGLHKERCNYRPQNLRDVVRASVQNRAAIEQQRKSHTTLTPQQISRALENRFGLEVVLLGGSSGLGSQGHLFSESARLCRRVCARPCATAMCGACAGILEPRVHFEANRTMEKACSLTLSFLWFPRPPPPNPSKGDRPLPRPHR